MKLNMNLETKEIAVIGLGYVGLPLAIEFGKRYKVLGYDINQSRIDELSRGRDHTNEADLEQLNFVMNLATKAKSKGLSFSSKVDDLKPYNIYIVTVPTPINKFRSPDLGPLLKASKMLGSVLKKGDIVIYESTVYPGCTEEDCVPVLEKYSELKFNKDFFCGYSPERINPGDKVNTLTQIKKVTSGSTPEVADLVNDLYQSIILAGTHKAPTIKVAEASKAIENAQRDVNISFVNELALIFDRMGIDTNDVLDAASTKWNFLKFKPGLVGGHCIGVDPYYLAQKAESLGYYPQVILSGRRVNDQMGIFIANRVIKLMMWRGIVIKGANVLILGITFKENCPDVRNTRVVDIYNELKQFEVNVEVYDPWASPVEVLEAYGIELLPALGSKKFDGVIVAVAHQEFVSLDYEKLKLGSAILFDAKSFIDRGLVDGRL